MRVVTPLLAVADMGTLLFMVDNMVAACRGAQDDALSDLGTGQEADSRSFLLLQEAGLAALIHVASP